MEGIFTIQRHKAIYVDGKWVLGELIEQTQKKNNLSPLYHQQVYVGADPVFSTSGDFGNYTFSDKSRIVISGEKIYTRHFYSEHVTTDTTDVTGKSIISEHVPGVEVPVLSKGTPNVITTVGRFEPPTQPRVINTLMQAYYEEGKPVKALSVTVLDDPCVQNVDEILTVHHRFQYNDDEFRENLQGIIDNERFNHKALANKTATGTGKDTPYLGTTDECFIDSSQIDNIPNMNVEFTNRVSHPVTSDVLNYHDSIVEQTIVKRTTDTVGMLYGSILHKHPIGEGQYYDSPDHYVSSSTKIRRPSDSVMQSMFYKKPAKKAKTRVHFADPINVSSMTGVCTVTDQLSDGNSTYQYKNGLGFAYQYRLDITEGGPTGTATYKLSRKSFTGAMDNAKLGSGTSSPQRNIVYNNSDDVVFIKESDKIPLTGDNQTIGLPYTEYEYIHTGTTDTTSDHKKAQNKNDYVNIVYFNQFSHGGYYRYDVNSIPSLPVTDIRQVQAQSNGTIWVACAETGLWKIRRTPGTVGSLAEITQVTPMGITDPSKCYGVCGNSHIGYEKDIKVIYALFNQQLAYTKDDGNTWFKYDKSHSPFFNLPDVEYDYVQGFKVNPDDKNIKMLVLGGVADDYRMTNGNINLTWWSAGGSTNRSDATTLTILATDSDVTHEPNLDIYNIVPTPSEDSPDAWLYAVYNGDFAYMLEFKTDIVRPLELSTVGLFYNKPEQKYYVANAVLGEFSKNNKSGITLTSIDKMYQTGTSKVIGEYTVYNGDLQPKCMIWNTGHGLMTVFGAPISKNSYISAGMGAQYVSICDIEDDFWENEYFGVWQQYGWNGIIWADGHPRPKQTHVEQVALKDGLVVSFKDDPLNAQSQNNWIKGHFIDTWAYDGIIKDDTTEFAINYFRITGPHKTGNVLSSRYVPEKAQGKVIKDLAAALIGGNATAEQLSCWYEKDYITTLYNPKSIGTPSSLAFVPVLSTDFTLSFNAGVTSYTDWELLSPTDITSVKFGVVDYGTHIPGTIAEPKWYVSLATDSINTSHVEIHVTGEILVYSGDDFDPKNDVLEFRAKDKVLSLWRNGTKLHEYSEELTEEVMFALYTANLGKSQLAIHDAKIEFNEARHIVTIGNGVDTGYSSDDFMSAVVYEFEKGTQTVSIDGKPAMVHTNGLTPPGKGEVTIVRGSGDIVCNSSDAGKSISISQWRHIIKTNK